MDWKNAEQYPDYTAGEAMLHVMHRRPEDLEQLDDEGCRLLAEAVIRLAAEDYADALRRLSFSGAAARQLAETEAFFRSEDFQRLSGVSGDFFLRRLRREEGFG